MAELPPPYAHDADEGPAAAMPGRRPSPPPSYEMVVQRDRAASSAGETGQQRLGDQRHRHRRLSSLDLAMASVSAARTAPPTAASSHWWQPSESDRQILAHILPKSIRGLWGNVSDSRDVALHNMAVALQDVALAGNEEHVCALLRANAPIAFTDSSSATKMPDGCALHAALRGAAPHLATLIADEFWTRACTAATAAATATATATTSANPVAVADAKTRALLDARDAKSRTPLHMAAQAGATDAVCALLARGAAIDARDDLGRTPLHMAARYGRAETVALLLALGADGEHLLQPALWERAAGNGFGTTSHLAELGDFAFIGRMLRPLLADARQQEQEETLGPVPHAHATADKPLLLSRPSVAAKPTYSLLPTTQLSSRPPVLRHHEPPRRDIKSMLHSPQYIAWRKDCDILLAEHRTQRERNRRSEVPWGMNI